MDVIVLQLFNGFSVSSILLLIALGLAITFGLMKVINMAHGELIMIGAYSAYVVQNLFLSYMPSSMFNWYFIAAIPFSFIVAFLIGLLLEATLIRFLYGRPLDSLLATWGIGLMLQQLARTIFGAPNVGVTSPSWLNGGMTIMGDVVLPYKRLFIIALVCLCLVAMYVYIYRSHSGRRMRAVMQNREMAACLGISTRRVDAMTFAIGSGIAGIAGCALTLMGPIGPSIGTYYIVDAFMVVVLGGVGKLIGTVFGALGIGLSNTVFEYWTTASLGKVLVFLCIVAFLQWKPMGLVAMRSRSLD
ncbi:High-affinity branched-chain amino acid transport system permease protein LivH [Paenibacillus plantiphilus]|uniref:High-affinity branched-chain amino acid transport system permease protein LivH n=1 Tax=Paenibacillus plantiphilus TaxID=2905650 RepID=A0ABN8GZR4_9BACL|nr:urea ABC transporter permease subunit UrtB [Paenibacillus plantiphilus]CAH1222869.1 High-affinity branched-chain amino acid transport system permease protein LivH [Paenibacillus plantiphilus]